MHRHMMTMLSGRSIGCIGKCTSGLTLEELDQITDHIQQTVTNPKGRKMFRRYLELGRRGDDLKCLDFYEMCDDFILKEEAYFLSAREPSLEYLSNDTNTVLMVAADLDGVPEIDMALLERFNEALSSQSREAMLSVLEDAKLRAMDHLRNAHRGFKIYALQPCPKTK